MSSSAIYGRTILHMSGTEHRRKAAILAKRLRNQKRLSTDLKDLVVRFVHDCGDTLAAAPADRGFFLRSPARASGAAASRGVT